MTIDVCSRAIAAIFILLTVAGCATQKAHGTRAALPVVVLSDGLAVAGSSPRHSPNGKWIAFTAQRSTASDIAIVPTAGGQATFLTTEGRSLHPAWSPDGSRIAFATFRADGASDIFLISPSGGTVQQVTSGPGQKIELDWSADGKRIIYAGNSGGNWAVWSIPAEGGEPVRLTQHAADEWNPRASADGAWIFFSTNWSIDGDINIWKIPASGGEPVAVTAFPADEFSPAPSPDGKRVAYLTDMAGLWVMDLVTGVKANVAPGEGFDDIVSWSPDGKTLIVGRNPHRSAIRNIDLEGRLIDSPLAKDRSAYAPDPSPDGLEIAFWSIDDQGNGDIWKVALDGSAVVRMTDHPAVDLDPAWSPDGMWIAYSSRREGSKGGDIWKLSTRGGQPERLTLLNSARYPRWCRGGKELVFQSDPSGEGTPHIWAVAAGGGPPRQITSGAGEFEPDCRESQLLYSSRNGKGTEIVIHDLSSGNVRTVTADQAAARKPRWSSDGSGVSFLSNKEGAWEVYSMTLAEGSAVRLTRDGGRKSAASWSPKGDSLCYSVIVGEPEIWSFPVANSHN